MSALLDNKLLDEYQNNNSSIDFRSGVLDERLKLALLGPTLITDGECHLCCASSNFIDARANRRIFFMWPQHPDTMELLGRLGISDIMNSWALIKDGEVLRGSNAWIGVSEYLIQPWKFLFATIAVVPEFIREWVYGLIAKNRYRWFGKGEYCFRPPQSRLFRFLHSTTRD